MEATAVMNMATKWENAEYVGIARTTILQVARFTTRISEGDSNADPEVHIYVIHGISKIHYPELNLIYKAKHFAIHISYEWSRPDEAKMLMRMIITQVLIAYAIRH